MNMLCYILGSGVMSKPYVFEIVVSVCVMMLFAFLASYGLKKAASVRRGWMSWLIALCGGLAIIAFLSTCFFFEKAFRVPEKKHEPFEKVEYEDHEYLIYKNREIIHNPNCPCRKVFNIKRECQ